ncbi:orotidine 5'-phosphate decarboxylase [Patescibacteria group bacterium]|nr:orotidine 5'-phosphate decarboxylase [Patescibacteria group bacterium]
MLSKKKKYLQIALNNTLEDAQRIISQLPTNDRIIIEAGTPLLKRYGAEAITQIKNWWEQSDAYIVADYKAMDRGTTEVEIAAQAGANAITVLGQAPIETINTLINACQQNQLDTIVDMMNVDQPYKVLRQLKKLPQIVMLHRGVDETEQGNKRFPIHQINKVKGAFNVLIAIGGGDTLREVQSAVFNGADIVMVWKEFYEVQNSTKQLATEFLQKIK